MSDKQADFFSTVQSQGPDFAEICNALYERELQTLAFFGPKKLPIMRRRLAGLSYHIKRIAYFLCQQHHVENGPLTVDIHNASWQCRQAKKSPARTADHTLIAKWYQQHAAPGLVVPVRVCQIDHETIELDSIDRVNSNDNAVHLNKFGWFHLDGHDIQCRVPNQQVILVKPTKSIMRAACCGHRWDHRSISTPRVLSLREMRLSTQIEWKRFHLLPIR